MKKIATALVSAVMLCAMLAVPALAEDHDGHGAWQARDGYHQYYNPGEHRGFDESRPQWTWNNSPEWSEHRDWDSWWHGGDRDDHWNDWDRGWYHRDDDR